MCIFFLLSFRDWAWMMKQYQHKKKYGQRRMGEWLGSGLAGCHFQINSHGLKWRFMSHLLRIIRSKYSSNYSHPKEFDFIRETVISWEANLRLHIVFYMSNKTGGQFYFRCIVVTTALFILTKSWKLISWRTSIFLQLLNIIENIVFLLKF